MSIVNALPGIVPSLRSYSMGEWPQRRMKMRNKRIVKWGLANISTNEKLELAWENITYAQAEQLVRVWDLNYGTYGRVTLPAEFFAGTETQVCLATLSGKIITTLDGKALAVDGSDSGGLSGLMALPFVSTAWRFTEPPRVTAVKAGRCTVQMSIGANGSIEQQP